MKRAGLFVWTLLLLVSPAALAEEDYLPPQALQEAGLGKYWQLRLTLDKGQHLQDVYLVDDHLYLGTQDGYVYAVHAPTGVLRWLRPITRSGYALRRPCRVGERLVFATPTDLQTYEARTGDPVSRYEFRFPSGSAPVTDGTRVFIGALDRRLYALEAETQLLDWRVVTDSPIESAPVVRGDQIFFASDSGTVYSCTRDKRVFRWQTPVYDRVSADLALGEDGVYVASRDYSLYCLDFDFGIIRWRARFSGPLDEAPVVTPGVAFQYCRADGLAAVDIGSAGVADERVRWKFPAGRTALTTHEDRVYVFTRDQTIAAVNIKTGEVGATVPATGFTLAMPAPQSATVFLASPDGRIFCARPSNVPPQQPADVLAALRPPGEGGEAAATSQPSTRPATAREPLAARQRGAPVGGKSKVSREFPSGTGEESD